MDEFRVDSPPEIARAAAPPRRRQRARATSARPTAAATPRTLWTMDSNQRKLSFSADRHNPQRRSALVDAGEAVAVAYLDSVKLQFDLHGLVLVHAARHCALQAAMPAEIYRFQRRGGFRVRTPATGSPVAHLRHPALPDMKLALRVLDVSMRRLRADAAPTTWRRCSRAGASRTCASSSTPTRASTPPSRCSTSPRFNPNSRGARIGCRIERLERRGAARAAALHRPDAEEAATAVAGLRARFRLFVAGLHGSRDTLHACA